MSTAEVIQLNSLRSFRDVLDRLGKFPTRFSIDREELIVMFTQAHEIGRLEGEIAGCAEVVAALQDATANSASLAQSADGEVMNE